MQIFSMQTHCRCFKSPTHTFRLAVFILNLNSLFRVEHHHFCKHKIYRKTQLFVMVHFNYIQSNFTDSA